MYYQSSTILSTPVGNNALSFEQRKVLGSSCTLTIPALIQGHIDDIKIGKYIVFEEVDHTCTLKQCVGLENLLEVTNSAFSPQPIYIMDNHNHALYFRYRQYLAGNITKGTTIIHVDQHADMGVPSTVIDTTQCNNLDYITQYTNEICNVGNFIQPAIDSGLIGDVRQVRSVTKLLEIKHEVGDIKNYIVDIDIDFRVSHDPSYEEIVAIHTLLQGASVCTIALSPYFIPLERSIAITKKIFS